MSKSPRTNDHRPLTEDLIGDAVSAELGELSPWNLEFLGHNPSLLRVIGDCSGALIGYSWAQGEGCTVNDPGYGRPHGGRHDGPPRDVSPGFIAEAGRCWVMVYDHNIQATHCDERPTWAGR